MWGAHAQLMGRHGLCLEGARPFLEVSPALPAWAATAGPPRCPDSLPQRRPGTGAAGGAGSSRRQLRRVHPHRLGGSHERPPGCPCAGPLPPAGGVLAVCNHTAPLAGLAPEADFWLTRVLARIAVLFPHGQRVLSFQDGWRHGQILTDADPLRRRSSALSALNWYNGASPLVAQKLLIDGTCTTCGISRRSCWGGDRPRLARLGLPAALAAALLLYLIGWAGTATA